MAKGASDSANNAAALMKFGIDGMAVAEKVFMLLKRMLCVFERVFARKSSFLLNDKGDGADAASSVFRSDGCRNRHKRSLMVNKKVPSVLCTVLVRQVVDARRSQVCSGKPILLCQMDKKEIAHSAKRTKPTDNGRKEQCVCQ